MNITITVAVFNGTEMKEHTISENAGAAVITDDEGKPLAIFTKYHNRSNRIFIAYRALYSAIHAAYRLGAETITIESDMDSLREELTYGSSGRLYTEWIEKAHPFDITVKDYDMVSDAGSQRALFTIMTAGASLACRSSDRWAKFN